MLLNQLPENPALADTIAKVFSDPAYGSQTPTLAEMILRWINAGIQSLLNSASKHPWTSSVVRWGLILVAVLIIARIALAIFLHYRTTRFQFGRLGSARNSFDPWAEAHQFAMAGRYTDAAHSLYTALLLTLAARGRVTLHESKTAGDYFRELKRRESQGRRQPDYPLNQGAGQQATLFRDFARFYETVVYNAGTCDADEYARLRELATPVIEAWGVK